MTRKIAFIGILFLYFFCGTGPEFSWRGKQGERGVLGSSRVSANGNSAWGDAGREISPGNGQSSHEGSELRDIKGFLAIRGMGWWPAVIASLAVTFISLAVWLWVRRNRKEEQNALPRSPADIADQSLRDLQRITFGHEKGPKAYYTDVSKVIQRYLEEQFPYRISGLTTEEYLRAVQSAPEFTPEQDKYLKEFFRQCDAVKFAGYRPSPEEREGLIKTAQTIIDQTKAGFSV
jgi:hypothetical protein